MIRTFGLYILLQAASLITMAVVLPDSFSGGEKFLAGMLFGWFMYKLIKEDVGLNKHNHP